MELKNENSMLKSKLDKSVEINNSLMMKEKQYETQIKQLSTRQVQLSQFIKNNSLTSSNNN
jgi:hypothetical protein